MSTYYKGSLCVKNIHLPNDIELIFEFTYTPASKLTCSFIRMHDVPKNMHRQDVLLFSNKTYGAELLAEALHTARVEFVNCIECLSKILPAVLLQVGDDHYEIV